MTTLESALLILSGLLAGVVWGALRELKRVKAQCWKAWELTAKAQESEAKVKKERDEALERLGAVKAQRGEVVESAIAVAKLAQLDALHGARKNPEEAPQS